MVRINYSQSHDSKGPEMGGMPDACGLIIVVYRQYVLLLYFPFISEGDLLPVHFLGLGPGLISHPSLSWPSVTIHKLLNPKPLFPAQMSPRSARYTHLSCL